MIRRGGTLARTTSSPHVLSLASHVRVCARVFAFMCVRACVAAGEVARVSSHPPVMR